MKWFPTMVLVLVLGTWTLVAPTLEAQSVVGPDTVAVRVEGATLRGLLWRPQGRGPFPAILVNHGSGRTHDELARLGPYEDEARTIGPVFARHGYVLFFPFRHGVGLSTDQGASAIDTMNAELAARGQDSRNALQLRLLEGRDMNDAMAALAVLRARADVDPRRVALVGHSFGGSLTVLQAARDSTLRAVVVFSGAGYSWDKSPELRTSLLAATAHMTVPAFFTHAANDYSVHSGTELDARLAQLGKPHRLKIYPAIGRTPDDGHAFVFLGVSAWEPDVFAFLDELLKR